MSKIVFLGIDAMDAVIVQRLLGSMPNLAAVVQQGCRLELRSTFPPDSDTAWASIVTGLNPARHGVVRFVDPLEKVQKIQTRLVDNASLRGRTFWDLAGAAGKRVCVLFPHLGYPPWQVNGVMTARSPIADDVRVYPEAMTALHPEVLAAHPPRGFPGRALPQMQQFVNQLRHVTLRDAKFGMDLLVDQEWDLFFIYWSTLDAVQHYFWDQFDQDAPGFQQNGRFRDVIPGFYGLFDNLIGRFLDQVSEDTAIIILSDHGHGMRPRRLFNVNELLRRHGFLVSVNPKRRPGVHVREKIKQALVRAVSRHRLGRLAGRAMRTFPRVTESFTRPSSIDWDKTIAYATDMSGIKAYSYGGIHVRKSGMSEVEYESVRERIINLVREECVTDNDESLLKFIARREKLYDGPRLASYPDILIELKYGFGLGQSIGDGRFGRSPVSTLMPGSHRGETPIFVIKALGRGLPTHRAVTMMDVAPTVLDLLGLDPVASFEGASIFSSGSRSCEPQRRCG